MNHAARTTQDTHVHATYTNTTHNTTQRTKHTRIYTRARTKMHRTDKANTCTHARQTGTTHELRRTPNATTHRAQRDAHRHHKHLTRPHAHATRAMQTHHELTRNTLAQTTRIAHTHRSRTIQAQQPCNWHNGCPERSGDRLNHGPQMGRPNHGSTYGRSYGCTRLSRMVRGQAVVVKLTTTADPCIWPVCSYDLWFMTSTISTVVVRTTMHGKFV